jgi:hypothetical protein
MIANNTGIVAGHLAGKYPSNIGHLYSPGGQKGPWEWMPYALDNGAFPAFTSGKRWEEKPWLQMLEWSKTSGQKPLWVLVPDVVGNKKETLVQWKRHSAKAKTLNSPLAFAAQDGMVPKDVPKNAEVVFLGGSTEWKRKNIYSWCKYFPRVHVGRINTYRWLLHCEKAGAESVDGTGWFRGDQHQFGDLVLWLQEVNGEKRRNENLVLSGMEEMT